MTTTHPATPCTHPGCYCHRPDDEPHPLSAAAAFRHWLEHDDAGADMLDDAVLGTLSCDWLGEVAEDFGLTQREASRLIAQALNEGA